MNPIHVLSVQSCGSLSRAPHMIALGMACRNFKISVETPSLPFQLSLLTSPFSRMLSVATIHHSFLYFRYGVTGGRWSRSSVSVSLKVGSPVLVAFVVSAPKSGVQQMLLEVSISVILYTHTHTHTILFICFWLCWVFLAVGFSLVTVRERLIAVVCLVVDHEHKGFRRCGSQA